MKIKKSIKSFIDLAKSSQNVLSNKRGQGILGEYVILLMIVVAAALVISTYVKNSFNARLFDARNHAIEQAREECLENCKGAIPEGGIAREYEPYYTNMEVNQDRWTEDTTAIQGGISRSEGVFLKITNSETKAVSVSRQKPPKDAS